MKRSTRASAAAAAAAVAAPATTPSKLTTKKLQDTTSKKPPAVITEHSPIATKTRSAVKAKLARAAAAGATATPTKSPGKVAAAPDSMKSKTKKLVEDLLKDIPPSPAQPAAQEEEAAAKPAVAAAKAKRVAAAKSVTIVEEKPATEPTSQAEVKPATTKKAAEAKPAKKASEAPKPKSKPAKTAETSETSAKRPSKKPAKPMSKKHVLYIGHVPEGFHEYEMLGFLGQFGTVVQARVSRSQRTGNSRGYAFVQFEDGEVAEIVRKTLHGYILLGRTLVCQKVSEEDVHENMFKKALTSAHLAKNPRRTTVDPLVSKIRDPRAAFLKRHNRPLIQGSAKQLATDAARERRLKLADRAKRVKLAEKKIAYEFDGYVAAAPAPAAPAKKSRKSKA